MLPRLALTFVLAALVCPAAVAAQSPQTESDTAAPAHVSRVDGAASIEREGRTENSPLNMPLLSGDRLRTLEGRVEVLFADGSTLHLDNRTTVDVQSDDLVRLTEGRLRLNIQGPARMVAYRIDSPAGSARITQPGEYRIALLRPSTELRAGSGTETQLEVAVVRGTAEIFTDAGSTPVRAGERAYASAGLMPSYAYAYNSANQDAFDRWSEGLRDVRLGVSSQYLPSDMQTYAPLLDQSGDWRYTESYGGYAWYPRVTPDWRPYYNGRWDSYPRYGWTWIGADPFAWPTHHYGRWGFSAGIWFWIPASRWAPAYVSWAYAPGYVSWCPLGRNNRPIFEIAVYNGRPRQSIAWRAWTSVSNNHFGARGFFVNQRAVNWDRVDGGRRPQFEPRSSAPGFSRDIAVPRNATPIRWAGSRDLPPQGGSRGISPRDTSSFPRDTSRVPPSSGRDVAAPRQAAPRYVNRGDEIFRSQTERPAPRPASPMQPREAFAVPRDPSATVGPRRTERGPETRTIPDGPARPSRDESSRWEPGAGQRPAPRQDDDRQDRAFPRPVRDPEARPAPTQHRPPMFGASDEGNRRPRPDPEPRSAPRREPPPERSAAPERSAPAERAAPRERAMPRATGGPAPRRGRGGL